MHRFDVGVVSADSSIVDPIGTGVDFHADNTTHRHVSPPTPIANHALWRCASQPLLARSGASVAAYA